jgi:hypothetical protein
METSTPYGTTELRSLDEMANHACPGAHSRPPVALKSRAPAPM